LVRKRYPSLPLSKRYPFRPYFPLFLNYFSSFNFHFSLKCPFSHPICHFHILTFSSFKSLHPVEGIVGVQNNVRLYVCVCVWGGGGEGNTAVRGELTNEGGLDFFFRGGARGRRGGEAGLVLDTMSGTRPVWELITSAGLPSPCSRRADGIRNGCNIPFFQQCYGSEYVLSGLFWSIRIRNLS
jgi:hypothetical protein